MQTFKQKIPDTVRTNMRAIIDTSLSALDPRPRLRPPPFEHVTAPLWASFAAETLGVVLAPRSHPG